MKKDQHLLLIDGMALLFRAFFATSVHGNFMMNSKGLPTNAINGFLKHTLTAIDFFKPSHVICCWDMGSKTFRSEVFSDYKANRNEAPVELMPQFDLAKESAASLNIPNIGLEGYEADDCIGTISKKFQEEIDITILSGDRDLLQLLHKNVDVALLQKGIGQYKIYTEESFHEEKGISPLALIDVKGLMGDSSDNYPGVKGIGEKTAYKLITEFHSVAGILENLDKLKPSQRIKIETDLEMLKLSRELAEIHCEVPLECLLEEAFLEIDPIKALAWIKSIEIRGMEGLLKKASIGEAI
ncbi:5'-3' exonuclease [Metabacillus sp. RGM 3146]|uniref:5'-3' exonuclease n=1 Tax=Metabacillus sp. RGM 3146 TaxID=3401092 RepID=UPI003B98EA9F